MLEIFFLSYFLMAIMSLILMIYNPLLGLSTLLLLRVMAESVLDTSHGPLLLRVIGAIIICISLMVPLINRKYKYNIPQIRMYLLYLFVSLCSFINSTNLNLSVAYLVKLFAIFSIYILFYNFVQNINDAKTALKYYVIVAIFPLAYGFYQYASGDYLVSQVHVGEVFHKLYSTYSHPNQFAFYLATVFFALIAILQLTKKNKLFYYIILISVVISILLTYSRSVWVSIAVCSMIAVLTLKRVRFVIILAILSLFLIFSNAIMSRFDEINNSEHAGRTSLDFRVNLTKDLLSNAVPENFLIGYGLGNAELVSDKYSVYGPIAPHNDYLRVIVETGIIGFLFFIIFIISCLCFIFKNRIFLISSPFLSTYSLVVVFVIIVISASNHLGSISTMGMCFGLLAILNKGFLLNLNQKEQNI